MESFSRPESPRENCPPRPVPPQNSASIFTKFCYLAKQTNFRLAYFAVPFVLSLVAAVFEAVTFGLLIPLLQCFLKEDFLGLRNVFGMRYLLDTFPAAWAGSSVFLVLLTLVLIYGAALFKSTTKYAATLVIKFQVRTVCEGLRNVVFGQYLRFGKAFFDQHGYGYLNEALIETVAQLGTEVSRIHDVWNRGVMNIAYFIILCVISWKLTLVMVLMVPPLYFLGRWTAARLKGLSESMAHSRVRLEQSAFNILTCIPLLMNYGTEEREKERFRRISHETRDVEFRMDILSELTVPVYEIFTVTALLVLGLAASHFMPNMGPNRIGIFLVYFYLTRLFTTNLGFLAHSRATFNRFEGPVNRILYLLNDTNKPFITEGKREFLGLKRAIDFQHLNFAYHPEIPVLRDLSATIPRGKMTALVGPSGAGKSTLIYLLLRFYEHPEGSILLDGVRLSDLSLQSTRRHMAYVSQDPLLFQDTFRNNITYGLTSPCPARDLAKILEKARLEEVVSQLPDGLDTLIGDRGVRLSGGERQRVSIARAMLKGSEILLLDEATSSLDSGTEKLVQEAICEAVHGKTAVIIAHRLSTIKQCHNILVIDNGAVVEQGSFGDLLARHGHFYQYWQDQQFIPEVSQTAREI